MKKLILIIVICGLNPINAIALGSATTEGGHIACVKKEWFADIMKFIVAEDKASVQAYLDANKCIILKKGLKVTITESPGAFGTKVGFAISGIKLWSVREALDY